MTEKKELKELQEEVQDLKQTVYTLKDTIIELRSRKKERSDEGSPYD